MLDPQFMVYRKIKIIRDVSRKEPLTTLTLAGANHCVGPMVWGLGVTSNLLFASSEPLSIDQELEGCHKAYDITRGVMSYQLNASEAGDAISVSTDGEFSNYYTQL